MASPDPTVSVVVGIDDLLIERKDDVITMTLSGPEGISVRLNFPLKEALRAATRLMLALSSDSDVSIPSIGASEFKRILDETNEGRGEHKRQRTDSK